MNEELKNRLQPEAQKAPAETGIQKVDPKFAIIRSMIEQSKTKLLEVLPRSMSAERMIRVALGTIAKNPILLQCTPQSVLLSLLTAAEAGLDVGVGKEAYMIPLWNSRINSYECQLWESYVGKIKRMINSGNVEGVPRARVVHEKDEFEVQLGTDEIIRHIPYWRGDPGQPILAYAVLTLKGGSKLYEMMRWDEVMAIKARAKKRMKDASSPWDTDPEEMAKKTVLHRIAKTVPKSSERLVETEEGGLTLSTDSYEVIPETGEIVEVEPKKKSPGRPKGSTKKSKEPPTLHQQPIPPQPAENMDAEPPPPPEDPETIAARERIAAAKAEFALHGE